MWFEFNNANENLQIINDSDHSMIRDILSKLAMS